MSQAMTRPKELTDAQEEALLWKKLADKPDCTWASMHPPRVERDRFIHGMKVTCKTRVEAYYSGYGGNPECWFEPGMVGTIGAVECPCVTYRYLQRGGTATFVCVDFVVDGREWRTALYYNNILATE